MTEYSLAKFLRSPFPIRYLPFAGLALSLLGFLDATYLTILHYKNAIPPCSLKGCEVVLTSKYATMAGIPIALIGAGFYLVLVVLAGILIQKGVARVGGPRNSSAANNVSDASFEGDERQDPRRRSHFVRTIPTLFFLLTIAGLVVGAALVYLQAFVLHAFCQYCLASEVIDFLLFDTAWWLYNSTKE